MGYRKTFWKDHVKDGDVVIQQGTPQSATNLNNLEDGNVSSSIEGDVLIQQTLQHKRLLRDVEGEIKTTTLTNSLDYPFNNSTKTIALTKTRDTLNYTITVEVVSTTGGGVGEVRVTDKQLNGFKLEYTGSAKEVKIKHYVKGGMHQ